MISIKFLVFCASFFVINQKIFSLDILPSVEENNILETADIIRNTSEKIFNNLQLDSEANKPWFELLTTVHNHLTSITQQDYNNLNEIAKLAHGYKTHDNITGNLITLINEILNEDPDREDDETLSYIDSFLNKLKDLKNLSSQKVNLELLEQFDRDSEENVTQNSNDTNIGGTDIWLPISRRIYKGDRTKIKHFPFMAGVMIFGSFQCAGSIISSDLIVTAASCVQLAYNNRFFRENPLFLSVHVGSSFYRGGGEEIPVLEVYFHPSYAPKTLHHNICLLRLQRRLRFKKRRVARIQFDKKPTSLPINTQGILILGWGAKSYANILKDPWENILSSATLDNYPIRECQDIYTKKYVTHQHFCAGFISKAGGACNHDVGGPGIVDGILMGVISFGSPTCGAIDAPTVFTKVGFYARWIGTIMSQSAPTSKSRTTVRYKMINTAPPHQLLGRYTYTVIPIVPTTTPRPIILEETEEEEVEALRIVKDKNIFKNFLKNSFQSAEAKEYEPLLENKHFVKNLVKHIKNGENPNEIFSPVGEGNVANVIGRNREKSKSTTRKEIVTKIDRYNPQLVSTVLDTFDSQSEEMIYYDPKMPRTTARTNKESKIKNNFGTSESNENNIYKASKILRTTSSSPYKITKTIDLFDNMESEENTYITSKKLRPTRKLQSIKKETTKVTNKMPSNVEYHGDFEDDYFITKRPKITVFPVEQETQKDKEIIFEKGPSNIEVANSLREAKFAKEAEKHVTTPDTTNEELQNEIIEILQAVDMNEILEDIRIKNDEKERKKVFDTKDLEKEMLTLLYLTEEEDKDYHAIELEPLAKFDSQELGAVTSTFMELTSKLNKSEEIIEDLNSVPRDVFYEILADAIIAKTKNKTSGV